MCTNYAPVQRLILRDIFGVEPPPAEWKPEAWPDYAAPIVCMDSNGRRDSVLASFGLVPRSRVPKGVRPYDTMNARSETVGEKRTFSGPWKKGQQDQSKTISKLASAAIGWNRFLMHGFCPPTPARSS